MINLDFSYNDKGTRFFDNYMHENAVIAVILYIADEQQTRKHYGGVGCSNEPELAIEDFYSVHENVPERYFQRVKHYSINFKELVDRNKAEEYARKIAEFFAPDFQVFYGIHVKNHRTHIHFCVNTINCNDYSMMPLDFEYSQKFFQYIQSIGVLSNL